MKKLGIFFFCLVIIFGFLTAYLGKNDWTFSGYLQNLSFEERPELPSLVDDDGNNVFETDAAFWTKCAKFFSFVWDCLKYPFEIIGWVFSCTGRLFGGLIS